MSPETGTIIIPAIPLQPGLRKAGEKKGRFAMICRPIHDSPDRWEEKSHGQSRRGEREHGSPLLLFSRLLDENTPLFTGKCKRYPFPKGNIYQLGAFGGYRSTFKRIWSSSFNHIETMGGNLDLLFTATRLREYCGLYTANLGSTYPEIRGGMV